MSTPDLPTGASPKQEQFVPPDYPGTTYSLVVILLTNENPQIAAPSWDIDIEAEHPVTKMPITKDQTRWSICEGKIVIRKNVSFDQAGKYQQLLVTARAALNGRAPTSLFVLDTLADMGVNKYFLDFLGQLVGRDNWAIMTTIDSSTLPGMASSFLPGPLSSPRAYVSGAPLAADPQTLDGGEGVEDKAAGMQVGSDEVDREID